MGRGPTPIGGPSEVGSFSEQVWGDLRERGHPSPQAACETQRLNWSPNAIPQPATLREGWEWSRWDCHWDGGPINPTFVTAECPDNGGLYWRSDHSNVKGPEPGPSQPNTCESVFNDLQALATYRLSRICSGWHRNGRFLLRREPL